jgi:hypothetical protein
MELPMATPTARSGLFFMAMAMAEPLSAAPPMTARRIMPRKMSDMPRADPVASAAPTSTSLIQAAPTEAAIRKASGLSGLPAG